MYLTEHYNLLHINMPANAGFSQEISSNVSMKNVTFRYLSNEFLYHKSTSIPFPTIFESFLNEVLYNILSQEASEILKVKHLDILSYLIK